MVLTLSIFAVSISLVMWRPRMLHLNEATAAALGAAVMLLIGILSPLQAWNVLQANANVLLFFLGLMIISTVADQAGFFSWCAAKSAKLAHGRGTALLVIIFGLGAALTAFFSNDATALILTPIVFTMVTRLKLNALPYVFACAFIANTASMLLPVSNPVNLLAVGKFGLTLGEYFKFLLLPSIVVIALNIVLFKFLFRKSIYSTTRDIPFNEPIKTDRFFKAVSAGLGLIAVGYVMASIFGWPLAYPAVGGAVILLACGFGFRRLRVKQVTSGISWHIFLFIFALALLVKGLENAGVMQALADGLIHLASYGPLQALFSVTLGTAVGSNIINNWSMMMVSVSSLGTLAMQGHLDKMLVYGAIMGADLGPNIAILGSLSSMLWLVLLRKRGLDIHPMQYVKLGLIVTPVLLIAGILTLYVCARIWG
jgi:arsenical pump membrane protein